MVSDALHGRQHALGVLGDAFSVTKYKTGHCDPIVGQHLPPGIVNPRSQIQGSRADGHRFLPTEVVGLYLSAAGQGPHLHPDVSLTADDLQASV